MLNEITACLEKGFDLGVRWTDENGRGTFDRIDEQYEELAGFAQCAQTGATPSVNGMDACNVAAIAESINTEKAVRFRSFDE